MDIKERINLQKNKEIPGRLKTASNSENEAIDNYILSRIKIRENLQEEQEQKELIEKIKKEIEDTFNK